MKKTKPNPNENRRYFSISKEFEGVKDIIKNASNASRYICEAIVEKHNRENGVNTNNSYKNDNNSDILIKFENILEKIYDKKDLENFIEFKIREIIQNIVTANQFQLLLNPALTPNNNDKKIDNLIVKNDSDKAFSNISPKEDRENYEDILSSVNKNSDGKAKNKDDMRNKVNNW